MKAHLMIKKRFLQKEDVEPKKLVTIRGFEQVNVAMQDQPEELEWVMYFDELEKGMVMKPTNIDLCTEALGTDETDEWVGKKIVLYNDPSIMYGRKRTGGIRIRKPELRQPMPVRAPDPTSPLPPGAQRDARGVLPGGGTQREPVPPRPIPRVPDSIPAPDQREYDDDGEPFNDQIPF